MTSLPLRVPKRLQDIPDVVGVYNICLRLEKSLQLAVDKGDESSPLPTEQGLKHIVKEISSCADDSALLDVGRVYYDDYIRACTFPMLNLQVSKQSRSDALNSPS